MNRELFRPSGGDMRLSVVASALSIYDRGKPAGKKMSKSQM